MGARMPDGRLWMIENLNIAVADSYCYADRENNCRLYGRLYTWESAQRRVCASATVAAADRRRLARARAPLRRNLRRRAGPRQRGLPRVAAWRPVRLRCCPRRRPRRRRAIRRLGCPRLLLDRVGRRAARRCSTTSAAAARLLSADRWREADGASVRCPQRRASRDHADCSSSAEPARLLEGGGKV